MPDEATPQESEDTSQVEDAAPEEGTPAEAQTPETDWERRYADLQPEYTRTTQENAQLRQILDAARQGDPQALAYLGLTVEEDDEDDYVDDTERLNALENWALEQYRRQQQTEEQAQRAQMEQAHINGQADELEKKYGSEFTDLPDEDLVALLKLADAMPNEQGLPDLIAAYEFDNKRWENRRQKWVGSKRSPQAPSGASAAQQPDLDDREQRRAWILERMQEA